MKIEMTTNWMDLIQPGLYGTLLGSYFEECKDEHIEDFKTEVAYKTAEILNEYLDEVICMEPVMKSPRFYNYSNDSIQMDMIVPDGIIDEMENIPDEAYEYFAKCFGSHTGYVSCMPYTKEKFEQAIHDMRGNYDLEMAIGMYLSWKYREQAKEIQEDFEDKTIDYICGNTDWLIDEED